MPRLLDPGDVLVVNDCKTVSGRIDLTIGAKPLQLTFCGLANEPGDPSKNRSRFYAFAKPAKLLKEGSVLFLGKSLGKIKVLDKSERFCLLQSSLTKKRLLEGLAATGAMPLPPYIKRETHDHADLSDYQTTFAKRIGGAATPTAGLHFTPKVIAELRRLEVQIATVTLVVGPATFIAVRSLRLEDHKMPAELGMISSKAAATINTARRRGRRIVAVGTTSLRLLEAGSYNGSLRAGAGPVSLFIKPGHDFKMADMLLTNFHPPFSTALALVSAICGIARVKKTYEQAAAHGLRFFSYGDCCLFKIRRQK